MNITAFAQYAGVSKAAVSRYFNGGYLSAEKRAQIAFFYFFNNIFFLLNLYYILSHGITEIR